MRPGPSTAWKQTVSGSISLPSPGCFSPFPHGTMRYRSLGVARLGEWAPQLHTQLLVLSATQENNAASGTIRLPGCHGLWRGIPNRFDFASQSLWEMTVNPCHFLQPRYGNACQLDTVLVWACPRSLATTRGTVLLPRPTEMFQFSRFPPRCRGLLSSRRGCPIRRWSVQCLVAAPRPFSQRTHVLPRHPAPRHPPFAHHVFPEEKLQVERK